MVDPATPGLRSDPAMAPTTERGPLIAGVDRNPAPNRAQSRRLSNAVLFVAIVAAAIATLALVSSSGAPPVRKSPPATTARGVHAETTASAAATQIVPTATASGPTATVPAETPTAVVTQPAVAPAAAAPAPAAATTAVATQAIEPSVAALVAQVEATGVDPGANWSWSMGDAATQCGAIPGNNVGTGCTFGAAGFARSVFSGSPTLALVAHELANAETENDAIPSLMSEVAAAEAGTSWSAIDAVASCLVEHFMGFQDVSAGTWQCPAALATFVAENIHNPVSATTQAPA